MSYHKQPAKVLEALGNAVMRFPALRIGQLIENAKSYSPYKDWDDLFYLDDDQFIEMLNNFTQETINAPR